MRQWSVAVTVDGDGIGGRAEDLAAVIADTLSELAPAIAISGGAVTVRVAMKESDVEDAVASGVGEVRRALASAGLSAEVRDVQATEWATFEERLEEPTYPELVGITEIADLLGTSRQRASELARSPKFPTPLADLAAGPVWLKPTVARFLREWDRKPGRPRSKSA
ncbi:MAG TPA: hypothetical protein VHI71_11885 [Actinomycetota bacterium]|nr:hypothetical protein [Actinomycetota bacterium]